MKKYLNIRRNTIFLLTVCLEELQKSGEIEYSKQYKSLEREAGALEESQK